jgi:hypothetical protein
VIRDALTAAVSDLAIVAVAIGIVVLLALIAYGERKYGRQAPELEPEIEYEDIWAGLTPDRDVRRAKARLSRRGGAA